MEVGFSLSRERSFSPFHELMLRKARKALSRDCKQAAQSAKLAASSQECVLLSAQMHWVTLGQHAAIKCFRHNALSKQAMKGPGTVLQSPS